MKMKITTFEVEKLVDGTKTWAALGGENIYETLPLTAESEKAIIRL